VTSYPALPDSPALARRALRTFALQQGAPAELQAAVALAVSEAVTNVVVHAYRDAPEPGSVEVGAALVAGELLVRIADSGSGLRAGQDAPGLGLGLAIIAESADGIDLRRAAGGGLELKLRFSLVRE
jgi:serine/threonine-protein kinase RsbW